MDPRRWHRAALVGLALLGAGSLHRVAADSPPAPVRAKAQPSPDELSPEEEQKLTARLNDVLASDAKILARFDTILQELQVVKLRATSRPRDEDD